MVLARWPTNALVSAERHPAFWQEGTADGESDHGVRVGTMSGDARLEPFMFSVSDCALASSSKSTIRDGMAVPLCS